MQEDILYEKLTDRVAAIFRDLRKQKGYNSYEAFAFDNEFSRAQYWRVENGRSNLTLRTIARLLVLHNRTIDDFATFLSKESTLAGTQ